MMASLPPPSGRHASNASPGRTAQHSAAAQHRGRAHPKRARQRPSSSDTNSRCEVRMPESITYTVTPAPVPPLVVLPKLRPRARLALGGLRG